MRRTQCLVVLSLCVLLTRSDIYSHQPRGSNNRLNEKSANRKNGNRMFDSQNNNRGGYNVGDIDAENRGFQIEGHTRGTAQFDDQYDPDATLRRQQYNMMYLEGSNKELTWTCQHGCGNSKNNCNFVLQWTCTTQSAVASTGAWNTDPKDGLRVDLQNGKNTGTPSQPNNQNNIRNTYSSNNNNGRGRHESEEWYYIGKRRARNKGLFTADQKLRGNTQIYTRQNPRGTRRGLEVPEERDYYPYWYPTIWRDLAWIGNDIELCKTKIAPESQNVKLKYHCVCDESKNKCAGRSSLPSNYTKIMTSASERACKDNGGNWVGKKFSLPQPACVFANWSQANNLGNVDRTARGGQPRTYNWKLPTIAQLRDAGCKIFSGTVSSTAAGSGTYSYAKLVYRIRYNISTMDYDPYKTNSSQNQKLRNGVVSPIQNNPTVDVGAFMQGMRLAINTAQTGRTFQDRSHIFMVVGKNAKAAAQFSTVQNVNVQGKRGNIVQTYPAVEYDFWPNYLEVTPGQCLHFQWTGSNTHNNGNPAGDGQAGDAGEGRGGTDRTNMVQSKHMQRSYPLALDKTSDAEKFWSATNVDCYWPLSGNKVTSAADIAVIMASGGYYTSEAKINTKTRINELLNNVGASFRQGLMCCVKNGAKGKEFSFICSRNNNFTNRSQKLKIVVK